MSEAPRPRRSAAFFVLVGGAAFATSSPLARYARPADPLVVAFGRVALAAILLVLADAPALAGSVRRMTPRQRLLVFIGGALLAAHFACYQWGLDHTSLPAAASLVSLEPLSVVLVAWALFGIRPRRVEQIALAAATAGAVVVGSASGHGQHRLVGDVVVLVAVALFGLYLAVARALRGAVPTRSYVALVYTAAAISLALMLPGAPGARPPAGFDLPIASWAAIALLALVPTVIGHTAVQAASRVLSPSLVALASPCETLGSIAIGAALLGEVPTGRELVGAGLILAGTTLALVTARA
ncbi:MAG TPA: DMT family transporter [Minicystis sp.]|nr:DMT family transporter [Minicystis sp.]